MMFKKEALLSSPPLFSTIKGLCFFSGRRRRDLWPVPERLEMLEKGAVHCLINGSVQLGSDETFIASGSSGVFISDMKLFLGAFAKNHDKEHETVQGCDIKGYLNALQIARADGIRILHVDMDNKSSIQYIKYRYNDFGSDTYAACSNVLLPEVWEEENLWQKMNAEYKVFSAKRDLITTGDWMAQRGRFSRLEGVRFNGILYGRDKPTNEGFKNRWDNDMGYLELQPKSTDSESE